MRATIGLVVCLAIVLYVAPVGGKVTKKCKDLVLKDTTKDCNQAPNSDDRYPHGTVCMFECREGCVRRRGKRRRVCISKWWRPRRAGLKCRCNPCDGAPSHPEGYPSDCDPDSPPYPAGHVCTFTCPAGYVRTSGDGRKFCNNGRWMGDDLVCEEQPVTSSCDQCVSMFQSVTIPSGFDNKTYNPSDEDLVNPDRGWWKYAASEDYHILTASQLMQYRSEGHTLIFRYYVLDLFVHSDISASFLTNLQDDLENARAAGVKIIPRFCYTLTEGNSADAPLAQALRHVAQLKPYLQANGDVIAVVQAGFIGTWGEWYYSDNYSTQDSEGYPIVTDDDWARRVTLLDAVLDAVPNDRMVQIRYMMYKRRFTDDDSPLAESEARSGSKKARIGHHNDCFLASDKDWGTFESLAVDYAYLSADTKYTVMGGETCNYNPPRSSCATAEQELALFHWSYLNPGYHPDVTGEWKQQGCYDRIGLHLGYRLELVSGTYRNAVPQGGTFCGRLEIRNVGYAAPFNPRQVRVVLQKDSAIVTTLLVTGVDPRDWHPGTLHSVPISVQLPSNLAAGNYQVSLWLPDPSPTISDRPEFSILLANTGVPDPLTGLNNLGHTLEVQPTGSGSC